MDLGHCSTDSARTNTVYTFLPFGSLNDGQGELPAYLILNINIYIIDRKDLRGLGDLFTLLSLVIPNPYQTGPNHDQTGHTGPYMTGHTGPYMTGQV